MALDCCHSHEPVVDKNEIYIEIGTFGKLGQCHYCHPANLDELFSYRWNNREVMQVMSKHQSGLQIRLCRSHAKQIAAASRLPG